MSEDKIYKENPEVIAYIKIENNKIVFDFDENRGNSEDIIYLLNNIVGDYIKKLKEKQQQ